MTDIKFDLDDITIIPETQSDINSRKECLPYTKFNKNLILPLMASPMDTVVNLENLDKFINNLIIPCLPRGLHTKKNDVRNNLIFNSFGLCEIESHLKTYDEYKKLIYKNLLREDYFFFYPNVLIDIANGHMSKLIPLIKKIKELFPDIQLMIGNIANPKTFKILAEAGASMIRVSIGSGAGCLSSANVSINYPLGSLITECYKIKKENNLECKIVVDGGMRNYSDIIKSLCLGSDYIMCGSIFNKTIESAGYNYLFGIRINNKIAEKLWSYNFPIKKKYRGMSTKEVQRHWGKTELVTAEGITKYQNVEYTLSQWSENFIDYLKSAMSYTNSPLLKHFIGNVQYIFITNNALNRFKK
jgi:hypothetical protein